ncbi:MAG: hypothetical protein NTZ39_07400 [Methanoregula sp.]|nr:hypothetical protein [Methanoregula sp.]
MKEDTRWKVIAGIVLIVLSILIYVADFLIFRDAQHLFLFFIGDLAFIPIEILIVSLIIDHLLGSREKQQRMEKLNMVIGMFFSTIGTPLLAMLSRADPNIASVQPHLVVGEGWQASQYHDVQVCLEAHRCNIESSRIDKEVLRNVLVQHEDFLFRLVENPLVFEHESFTDLLLAVNHLTEELKARGDLSVLPAADQAHLTVDMQRVYVRLVHQWLRYMEYLRDHYPYLFSLAMRKNPFDPSASVVIGG